MKDAIDIEGKCPFSGDRIGGAIGSEPTIEHWWPNRLKVELLHQDPPQANPLRDFDYRAAFEALDLAEVKADIKAFLTTSVEWWPSDYGNYGPQMIRMAWHSAGTYRIADGRGGSSEGMLRFAPLNSWWDNGNIDKSRRLLWPIKQKYGASLSWADLMVLTGNCALEIMGLPTFGYGGGRRDAWEADRATYWGPEGWNGEAVGNGGAGMGAGRGNPDEMVTRTLRWEGDVEAEHYDLENPLAASHQALIYVNPEGPNANGIPLDSARDIRITFGRMAMNDAETVALIAGGHAFGKSHGKVDAARIGPAPEAAPIQAMGMGWQNPEGTGFAEFTMTNGIEGAWTPNPTQWDNDYLTNLFKFDWKKTKSPAGATQWTPEDPDAPQTPDAHIAGRTEPLMMTTADIALKEDPAYREICLKYLDDFDAFTDAFSRAWYKLTHRDLGPKARYLGPEVAAEDLDWQDPIPARDHPLVDEADLADLAARIRATGLSVSELVGVAWASASNYRDSDKRGGANGARIALAPQKDWTVNNPAQVAKVVRALTSIRDDFNGAAKGGRKVSLADLVVLGGCLAVKKAAADAGVEVDVPFTPGRMDTTQELTDVEQFDWLQPVSDGFRNYHDASIGYNVPPEQIFLDRAALLKLSAPEWTALVGGLRVLDTNYDGSRDGVFTDRPGVLSNDFFVNLTSMDYEWEKTDETDMAFEIRDRKTKERRFTATRCDLIFGSNAQLRAIAEVYGASGGQTRLVHDFVAAWDKVMMLDRFDVHD